MAELFMECEEEELEPWQQKEKAIVVDDDDDDDEPIFVGEIVSSKPANTYILNRVNPKSPRMEIQNGAPKRGTALGVPSGFPATTRPGTSTLAVQPQPRASSVSGISHVPQRPLSGCSSPQDANKSNAGISPPINRSATTQSLSRNLSIPVLAQTTSRPVATVTAQPVVLNRVTPNNTPNMVIGLTPNSGLLPCQSGSVMNSTGLSKRPSTFETNSIIPKKAKTNEIESGSESPVSSSVNSLNDTSSLQKGVTSGNVKNAFPQACPKCNIHFNLLDPLKNHMKYCCPDMVHTFLGISKTDCSGTSTKITETETGKLIMLVNDFYYGKYEGNVQQVHQEQKTHTTFKCASCMKLLKNNLRFMNHMKHHLEFEKQNSESWESHTTCQHCYRQFPTPFQLQCHIESTHTPVESSTVCKICELSFETEQVLLQHMKDNHKPGEMPYVCQVCSYRSSAFSDVDKHFRAVHENTKNLLCPFCLKVIKIGAPYMHHYMRHQKKGVHRCTKCRLQFLTSKEKMDHKSQHHRTFKKPVQLEGLPPGTKVTIRASIGSLQLGTTTTSSISTSTSTLQLSPSTIITNTKNNAKLNTNKTKSKSKPLSVQKKQSVGTSSSTQNSSSNNNNKRNNKIVNTALNNLRCSEIQKCIECYSDIRTFASHFPAYVRCSLCRYSTSCSKAYVNHMMSFHSARQSKRFWIYKTHSEELRGFTVVCLNCEFLTDVSGLDKMATHLNEQPSHSCQVIIENVPLNFLDAENSSDLMNNELPNNESEEKCQKISRPTTPEGKEETSASASQQLNDSTEETKKDHTENQANEGPSGDDCKKSTSLVLEDSSGPEVQDCSKHSIDAAEEEVAGCLGNQTDKDLLAAEVKENKSSVSENSSVPEVQACSKDPTDFAEEGNTDSIGNQTEEATLSEYKEEASLSEYKEEATLSEYKEEATLSEYKEEATLSEYKDDESASTVEDPSISDLQSCSKDSMEESASNLKNQGGEGPLTAQCEENKSFLVVENSSCVGVQDCSKDHIESAEGGNAGSLGDQGEVSLAAGCKENKSIPESSPRLAVCSSEPIDSAEEANGVNLESEVSLVAESKGSSLNVESATTSELQICSKVSAEAEAEKHLGDQVDECEESTSATSLGDSNIEPQTSSERTKCGDSDDNVEEENSQKPKAKIGHQSSDDVVSNDAMEVPDVDESLAGMNTKKSNFTSEDGVSFEQFLRRRGETESVSSDASEQGSVHLEPLTPSEVLEHETTEILQKGGVATSAKKAGLGSEQTDVAAVSTENSPIQEETSVSQTEESDETS